MTTDIQEKSRRGDSNLELPRLAQFLNGTWQDGGDSFTVRDKFSGAALCEMSAATRSQVDYAISGLQAEFEKGPLPANQRAAILNRLAALIKAHHVRLRDLIVAESGFTLADADGEIDRAVITAHLCAEEATRIAGDMVPFGSHPGAEKRLGFTLRLPIGVVCAITPFNSPLNTVLHKIGPALAAGNPFVLKPSNLTPLTASLLCELLLEAGLPGEQMCLLQGRGSDLGDWLVRNESVAFYTFTGSTRVGALIQSGAGLRRTQMELGSIASTILCADADLDLALPRIAKAAFRKAGQVCTSVQRLYVEATILDDVNARLAAMADAMVAGDPMDPATEVGPMITSSEAERAEAWISQARDTGAKILAGGTRAGSVMSPTLVTAVRDGMRVVDEEIFAPCVSTIGFTSVDEAISHANHSPYGLAAGVFTSSMDTALAALHGLRFGSVHINETSSARADAMPFGGVKASGFGHEGPRYAIREMTEQRLVTFN